MEVGSLSTATSEVDGPLESMGTNTLSATGVPNWGGAAYFPACVVGVPRSQALGDAPGVHRQAGPVRHVVGEDGQHPPVSGMSGFWAFIPYVGGIIWFVKVQGALNRYWESKGVPAS